MKLTKLEVTTRESGNKTVKCTYVPDDEQVDDDDTKLEAWWVIPILLFIVAAIIVHLVIWVW